MFGRVSGAWRWKRFSALQLQVLPREFFFLVSFSPGLSARKVSQEAQKCTTTRLQALDRLALFLADPHERLLGRWPLQIGLGNARGVHRPMAQ